MIHREVFFTQENYKKYSCVPSFVEFLEKHLHSTKDRDCENQNSHDNLERPVSCGTMGTVGNCVSTGRGGSNLAPACLGPEMEFPFVSKISIESQRLLLEAFEMIKSGELAKVDLQKMSVIQVCWALNFINECCTLGTRRSLNGEPLTERSTFFRGEVYTEMYVYTEM